MSDKITDEMIEAGMRVMRKEQWLAAPGVMRALVQDIYTAMSQAHPTDEKPVCAQCEGVLGGLDAGREPEEFCDTCYSAVEENMRAHPTDEEEVERVARAMFDAREERRMASANLAPSKWENHRDYYVANARAALNAIGRK